MGYELCFYISLKIETLYSVLDRNGKDGPRQPSCDLINGYCGKCDLKGANRIVLICYDEQYFWEVAFLQN